MKTIRNHSIDTLRFLANFCIILSHTRVAYAFPTTTMHGAALILSLSIYNICRLSLPFFFIISGYFFTKAIIKKGLVKSVYLKTCKKLLLVLFFYQILYGLIPTDSVRFFQNVSLYGWIRTYYWYFLDAINHPFYLFFLGNKYHLWFLPALTVGISTLAAFYYFKLEKYLWPIVCVFYAINLGFNIHEESMNQLPANINVLVGICGAITYVFCGGLIARLSWKPKTAWLFLG